MLVHLVDGTQRLEDWATEISRDRSPECIAASDAHPCVKNDFEGLRRRAERDLGEVLSIEIV